MTRPEAKYNERVLDDLFGDKPRRVKAESEEVRLLKQSLQECLTRVVEHKHSTHLRLFVTYLTTLINELKLSTDNLGVIAAECDDIGLHLDAALDKQKPGFLGAIMNFFQAAKETESSLPKPASKPIILRDDGVFAGPRFSIGDADL